MKGFSKILRKLNPRLFNRKRKLKGVHWKNFHLTTKVGPSGKQALVSSLSDLKSIKVLHPKLYSNICKLGGPSLEKRMDLLYCNSDKIGEIMNQPIDKSSSIRRIHSFPDSEGKTRVIAIGDY